jgi:sterol 3beta-glucosyltransferase
LRQAGHEVTVATHSEFTDLIVGCGLRTREWDVDLGTDADLSDVNPRKMLMKFFSPNGIRATGEAMLDTLEKEPADILLLSPLTELAGHPAEAREIPSLGVRLQPLSTSANHPPAILGAWSAGSVGNAWPVAGRPRRSTACTRTRSAASGNGWDCPDRPRGRCAGAVPA